MSERSSVGKMHSKTSFRAQGARKAGCGMLYDDYSENSGYTGHRYHRHDSFFNPVRFPNDDTKPENLNGECIIIQAGKKKEG